LIEHLERGRVVPVASSLPLTPTEAVQTILGHRSAAFTLSVYGHLFDADLDDLAARLDSGAQRVPTALAALEGGSR
jgi:integrase